ncbi:hypothetical protein ACIGB6_19645 [Paeniglutamicibacter gangotriensis]|uniref:hypothetical protein n=1 Tax=Paeniglutamicibacter gangotriensis TaxID=254787 RepID=UPI0037C68445
MVPAQLCPDDAVAWGPRHALQVRPRRAPAILLVLASVFIACLALVGGVPGHPASHHLPSSTGPLGAPASFPASPGEHHGSHTETVVHQHGGGILTVLLVLGRFRRNRTQGLHAFWVSLARRRGPPPVPVFRAPAMPMSPSRAALGVYRL